MLLDVREIGPPYRDGWLAPTGDTRHGALGTFPFYLAYCREIPDDQWWLPTTAEVQQRAEEIRREHREQAAARILGVRQASPVLKLDNAFCRDHLASGGPNITTAVWP